MFFSVRNPTTGKTTHCGVQEFTAEQGTTYFPYWMMKHLGLPEGGMVVVRQVELLSGTGKEERSKREGLLLTFASSRNVLQDSAAFQRLS